MANSKFTFHRLLPLLLWVKTIATWKIVIESMQSLGMDNFRMAYTRFLALYSDNPSGLHDGETPAKWQTTVNFATHPSTETKWFFAYLIPGRIGNWKCWFLRRGENHATRRKTSRSNGENQQQTQPTYGVEAGI